eukprot:360109-Chlamydomonas_euryale.AAC.4
MPLPLPLASSMHGHAGCQQCSMGTVDANTTAVAALAALAAAAAASAGCHQRHQRRRRCQCVFAGLPVAPGRTASPRDEARKQASRGGGGRRRCRCRHLCSTNPCAPRPAISTIASLASLCAPVGAARHAARSPRQRARLDGAAALACAIAADYPLAAATGATVARGRVATAPFSFGHAGRARRAPQWLLSIDNSGRHRGRPRNPPQRCHGPRLTACAPNAGRPLVLARSCKRSRTLALRWLTGLGCAAWRRSGTQRAASYPSSEAAAAAAGTVAVRPDSAARCVCASRTRERACGGRRRAAVGQRADVFSSSCVRPLR